MNKLTNITPAKFSCTYGLSCPGIYRSEDGETFTIVGKTQDCRKLPEGSGAADDESIVEIPADLVLASLGVTALVEAAERLLESDGSDGNPWDAAKNYEARRALRSALDRMKGGDAC